MFSMHVLGTVCLSHAATICCFCLLNSPQPSCGGGPYRGSPAVVAHNVMPPPLGSNVYCPPLPGPMSASDPTGQLAPLALSTPARRVRGGAPSVRWPQRWTQPPSALVPRQSVELLPSSISHPAGHCPPGSAADGSENATSPVKGARPTVFLRPTQRMTKPPMPESCWKSEVQPDVAGYAAVTC